MVFILRGCRWIAAALLIAALVACSDVATTSKDSDGRPVDAADAPSPEQEPIPRSELDGCIDNEDNARIVNFRTKDGVRIAAAVWGRGSRGVVLGHQINSNVCEWEDYAPQLAASGRRVMAIDFRGSGSSGAEPSDGPQPEDMLAAARWLRKRGATSVVLMGASMGATVAIIAGAQGDGLVNGVVSLSGVGSVGDLDAMRAVRGLRLPALFLAAKDDSPAGSQAYAFHRRAPSPDKRLKVYPGALHGVTLFVGEYGDSLASLIERFLNVNRL